MTEPVAIATIVVTLLLSGTVKGIIGFGLPTLSLGLLTAVFDLPVAMALIIFPSLVANLWQAIVGGHGRAILRRIWPFLFMATLTIWIGAKALTHVDLSLLSGLLGVLLIVYAAISLLGVHFTIGPRQEVWAGPVFGTANGILTGMTGSFVVPGLLYLRSIGMPRDMLVQAMGMLFLVSTLALAVALQRSDYLTVEMSILSVAAVPPAIAGMLVGRRIRKRLSNKHFQTVFFSGILLLGGYIAVGTALEAG